MKVVKRFEGIFYLRYIISDTHTDQERQEELDEGGPLPKHHRLGPR